MAENKLTTPQKKHIEKHIEKHLIKQIPSFFTNQFKQHVSTAIIAAFSFLIALTWKDLIIHFIDNMVKPVTLEKYPYIGDLYSAFIVTFVAIIGIALVTKWAKKPEIITSEESTSKS